MEVKEPAKEKKQPKPCGCISAFFVVILVLGLFGAIISGSSKDTHTTSPDKSDPQQTTEHAVQPTQLLATITPAKPLTLKEKIKQQLPDSMSEVSIDLEDAIDFQTTADVPGKKDVTIEANHTGTYWDVKSTKQATWNEAAQIIGRVFPLDKTIDGVIIMNDVPVTTAYGKKDKGMLTTISISRATYNKIDFRNFDYKNIPTIADHYVENRTIGD